MFKATLKACFKKSASSKDSYSDTTLKTKNTMTKKSKYIIPGQTKDTPAENDSLRKFYTSLLKQNKNSAMAIKWCTERGLMRESMG
jgi:hypothetical protein